MPLSLPHLRLANQQLTNASFTSVKDLVRHMGAIQAQDYTMSKWAIGCRLPGVTDQLVEKAFNKAWVVRTHVLRPTWHIVPAADVKWMLQLTAPQIQKAANYANKNLGLTPETLKKTNRIIEKALRDNNLTREELMARVAKAKILVNPLRASHIMLEAELRGMVCSGPVSGKKFTYTLIDKAVPKPRILAREEALAELAKRYFTSHGPATLQDFTWWSGLTITMAKEALSSVKNNFLSQTIQGKEYWHKNTTVSDPSNSILFLPAYDEYIVSYKDRSAILEDKCRRAVITVNGIFNPVIVVNGKVVGTWKRSTLGDDVTITPLFFTTAYKFKKQAIDTALEPYREFINTP